MAWIRRFFLLCAVLAVSWVGLAGLVDLTGGRQPAPDAYEFVVVAGAGVRPGGMPSGTLVQRTQRAAALFHEGRATRLAVTGGVGDWPPAEADVAWQVARTAGVPGASIIIERTSTSTEENARFLRQMIGDARILVVTDRFHVFRCERVFGRYFSHVDAVGVVPPASTRAYGSLREVLAIAWYAVRGRL